MTAWWRRQSENDQAAIKVAAFVAVWCLGVIGLQGCATQRDFDRHMSVERAVQDANSQSLLELLRLHQRDESRLIEMERRLNDLSPKTKPTKKVPPVPLPRYDPDDDTFTSTADDSAFDADLTDAEKKAWADWCAKEAAEGTGAFHKAVCGRMHL